MRISYKDLLRLTALIILLTITLNAQEKRLIGTVVDAESGDPLKGADVYLTVAKDGASTDEDGVFILRTKADITYDTLVVNFLGYQEYRRPARRFKNLSSIRLAPAPLQQDSVTVRADRLNLVQQEIPHARSTLSFEEIEIRGTSEISDLFKAVPSVRVEGNDISGRQIQIRGSNPGEVNIYVDGILINSLGLENAADLSIVPIENIETLEVLKGANLTLMGNGAFGGVVNVTTKRSLERSLFLKTKQGSFDSQYYIGELNLPLSGKFVINYFGQYNDIKPGIEYFPGEARNADKTENDAVETRKQNHNVSMNYYSEQGEFSTRFYGYVLDYEKLSFDGQPLANNRKNYLLSSAYSGSLGGLNDFDLRVNYLLGDDIRRRDRLQPGSTDRFEDGFKTNRMNIKFMKKFPIKSTNEFQLLTEYFHDELDISTDQELSGVKQNIYQAELYENRWSVAGVAAFSDKLGQQEKITWKTHFGLRGDFISNGDNYVSPTVGLQVSFDQPRRAFIPYMSYGKNVRIPTLLENAYTDLGEISRADTTLRRLKPEESNAFELGLGYQQHAASGDYETIDASLAFFHNVVFNKLVTVVDFVQQDFDTSQIGRNVTVGVEGSLKFNRVLNLFDLQGTATYLDIERPSLYPFKPRSMFSVQLSYAGRWGGYFSATAFYEGESRGFIQDVSANNPNAAGLSEVMIDPFYDLDLSIGYRFRLSGIRWNLQAAGYNILDNSGFQFYLLKKQYFQVSLSARL